MSLSAKATGLFPAANGGYLDLHNFRNRDWKPAQLAAGRSREGDEEGIALRVDLHALIGRERLTQDEAMLGQRPRVLLGAQFAQQLGRTLDVGEEKGDGARRQLAHLGEGLRFLRPNASKLEPHAKPVFLHRWVRADGEASLGFFVCCWLRELSGSLGRIPL
jgi:hypothetical protein